MCLVFSSWWVATTLLGKHVLGNVELELDLFLLSHLHLLLFRHNTPPSSDTIPLPLQTHPSPMITTATHPQIDLKEAAHNGLLGHRVFVSSTTDLGEGKCLQGEH